MPTKQPLGFDGKKERVPVYILAGGRSRRFGRDKARELIGNVPLLVQIAETLSPFATSTTVVAAGAGKYDDLGLRTIGDVVKNQGPIGGLITALHDCSENGWIFLTACDWLGLRPEWVRLLLSRRNENSEAVVFASGRYEPLFGLYHTSIRDVVSTQLEFANLAMQELLERIATATVPTPDDWQRAVNLNRPLSA